MKKPVDTSSLRSDPLWYKDAIIYELNVRAFQDSNGDGIGDFPGVTSRLDYLQDLGITAIWLLPFYPSPLRDDGYDVSDYMAVNPAYGSLADFRKFLHEAHRRDIRIITELLINHTSDQHPWFQRARQAARGSNERNFYVWSDNQEKYKDARIIFKDYEESNWTFDRVAAQYFWHRFFHYQPDLNFDNPAVRKAVFDVVDFWLGIGVDGMRLDAVPYLYEADGTNCENLPAGHAFLKELRRHVDERFPSRMLLAEANQWPEDAAAYFGQGDECQMNFHFPVMPRLFMALRTEDRFPIIDIMEQTPAVPDSCQWALFLRNHDELTLEMVTDEERDYMYRFYAADPQSRINLGIRRRLAPLCGNDLRKIELMNALLFSLPGTPIIYYGDEFGMGDNIYLGDRNGVRTPMQWSANRNAGFSRAHPEQLYTDVISTPPYHYDAINVEAQQANPSSLLWLMKRLIEIRKRHQSFGRGSLEFLHPTNPKLLVFLRRSPDETVLVVANLSRFAQASQLDLSEFVGLSAVELFSQSRFPNVTQDPYSITLGPYGFYWVALQSADSTTAPRTADSSSHSLHVEAGWETLWEPEYRPELTGALLAFVRGRPWFAGGTRQHHFAEIVDAVPIDFGFGKAYVTLLRVEYTTGEPETYQLPVAFRDGERALRLRESYPQAIICSLTPGSSNHREGLLYDAVVDPDFCRQLVVMVGRRRTIQTQRSGLFGNSTNAFAAVVGSLHQLAHARPTPNRDHSLVRFGNSFLVKILRRVDEGPIPEQEISRHLTERARFSHALRIAGAIEHRLGGRGAPSTTLCLLQEVVPSRRDAWVYTLDSLKDFIEHVLAQPADISAPVMPWPIGELVDADLPQLLASLIGPYVVTVELLGRRTAEMHFALASAPEDLDFVPEPVTELYQRGLSAGMQVQALKMLEALREALDRLAPVPAALAQRVLDQRGLLIRQFQLIRGAKMDTLRTRVHGNLHLGRVLYTGGDFVFRDFSGEADRSASEQRLKRSPLYDVASMVRSFDYALRAALHAREGTRVEDIPRLQPWTDAWWRAVTALFLRGYLRTIADSGLVPHQHSQLQAMLQTFLLQRAVHEVGFELNHRPDWLEIPLEGLSELLNLENWAAPQGQG